MNHNKDKEKLKDFTIPIGIPEKYIDLSLDFENRIELLKSGWLGDAREYVHNEGDIKRVINRAIVLQTLYELASEKGIDPYYIHHQIGEVTKGDETNFYDVVGENKKNFKEIMKNAYREQIEHDRGIEARVNFIPIGVASLVGLFFLSSNLTGNVISSSVQADYNIVGGILLVIGLILTYFYFKRNKKLYSKKKHK